MISYLKFVASIIIIQAIIWTRCQSKFFDYYGDNRGGGDDGGGDPRPGDSSISNDRDVEYLANYENFEPQDYMGKKSIMYNRDNRNFELSNSESEPVFEPDFQIESPQQYNSEKEYYYTPYRGAEKITASPYPADSIISKSEIERFFVQEYDFYIKPTNSETLKNGTYKRSPDSNSTHISENSDIQNDPKFSGEQTDEDKTTANVGQNFETLSVQYLIKTNSPNNHDHEEMPVETSTIINKVETTSNDNRADENAATTTKFEISSSTDTSSISISQPRSNDYDYDSTISEKSNIINSELEKVPSSLEANVNVDTANSIRITTTRSSTNSSLVGLEIDENKITSTLTIKQTQSVDIYINDEDTDKVDGEILTTTSTTIIPLSAEQPAITINIPLAEVEDQTPTIGHESNVTSSSSSYEDISSTLIDIITKSSDELIEIPKTTMGLDETIFIPEPDIENISIKMDKDMVITNNNDNSLTTEDQSEPYEEIGSENSTDNIVYLGLDQNTSTSIISEQNLTNGNSNRTFSFDASEIKLIEQDDQISSTLVTEEFETNLDLSEPEITTILSEDGSPSDMTLFKVDNNTTTIKTSTSEEILISEDYNVILNSETNKRKNNRDLKIIENETSSRNSNTIDMDVNVNATTITAAVKTLMGDEMIISTKSELEIGDYLIKRNTRLDSPPEKSDSSDSEISTYIIDIQSNGSEAENKEEVELDKNLKSPLNPTTDISVTITADNQSGPGLDESSTIKEMKVDDEEEKLRRERVEIKYSTGIYTKNDTKNESQSQQLNQTQTDSDTTLSSDSDGNDYRTSASTSSGGSSKNRNNNLTIMTGYDGVELSDQNQNITINLIEEGDTNNKNNNSSSSRVKLTTSKMSTFGNNINDSSFRRMGGSSELLNEVKDLTSTDKDMNMKETTGSTGKSKSQSSAADDPDRAKVVTKSSIIFEKIVEINESSLQDQKDKNTQAFIQKESRSIGGLKNAISSDSSRELNEILQNTSIESQKTSEERFLEKAENEMNDFAKHLVSMDGLLVEKSVSLSSFENKRDIVEMDQSLPTNDTSLDSSTLFDNTTEILEPLEITTNLSGENSAAFYDSNLKIPVSDIDNEVELEENYKNRSKIKIELILENATESQILDPVIEVEDTYSITGPNEALNSTLEEQINNILLESTTKEIVSKIYSEKLVENDVPILVNPPGTLSKSSTLTYDEPEVIEENLIMDLKSIDGEIELAIPSNEIVKNSSSSGNINNSFNAILRDQNESGLEMNSQIGDKNALLEDKIEIILDQEFSRESSENSYTDSSTTDTSSADDLDQKFSFLNPSFEKKKDKKFSESTPQPTGQSSVPDIDADNKLESKVNQVQYPIDYNLTVIEPIIGNTTIFSEDTLVDDFMSTDGEGTTTTMAAMDQVLLMNSEMKRESKILNKINQINYNFEKEQIVGITIVPESGSNVTSSIYTSQKPDFISLVRIDSNLSTTSEIEDTKNYIELKPEVDEMGVKKAEIKTTNTTTEFTTFITENFVKENPSSKVNELGSPLELLTNSTSMNVTSSAPEVAMKPTSYNLKSKTDIKMIGRGFKGKDLPSEENTDTNISIYLKPNHIELRLEPEVKVMPKSLEQIAEISILEETIETTTTSSTSITSIIKPEESSTNNDTISYDLISSTISSTETDSIIDENVKSSIILEDPKWVDLTIVQEKRASKNALEFEGNALDNYSDFTTKSQTTTTSDDVLIILQTTNPTTEAESYTISSLLLAGQKTFEKGIISSSSIAKEEKPVGDELLQVVRSSTTSSSIEGPRMGIDINEISFSQKEQDYVENDINKNFDDEDQKIDSVKVQEIIEEKNFPSFDNLRLSPSSFSSTLFSSNSKQLDNTITRINDDETKDRSRKNDGPFGLTVEEKYDEIKPSYEINNNNIMKNRVKGFERTIPSGSRFSATKTTTTGKTTEIYTSPAFATTAVSAGPTNVMFENILKNDGSTSFSPNTFSSSSTKTPPSSSLSLKQCLDRPIKCQYCHGQPPVHICGSDLRIYQNECEFLCHWKICPVLRRVEFTVCWSKVTHHQIFQEQVPKPKIKKPQPPLPIKHHMDKA